MLAEVADVPDAEGRLLRAVARDEVEEDGGRGRWDLEHALRISGRTIRSDQNEARSRHKWISNGQRP